MNLSKREYKFRQKLINTYNCNKEEQKILDDYIKDNKVSHSYYHPYKSDRTDFALMIRIGLNSACVALNKLGITVKNPDNICCSLGDVMSEVAEKWKTLEE